MENQEIQTILKEIATSVSAELGLFADFSEYEEIRLESRTDNFVVNMELYDDGSMISVKFNSKYGNPGIMGALEWCLGISKRADLILERIQTLLYEDKRLRLKIVTGQISLKIENQAKKELLHCQKVIKQVLAFE
jgi:hypothetical protein